MSDLAAGFPPLLRKSQKGDFQREERGMSGEIRVQSALGACQTWTFAVIVPETVGRFGTGFRRAQRPQRTARRYAATNFFALHANDSLVRADHSHSSARLSGLLAARVSPRFLYQPCLGQLLQPSQTRMKMSLSLPFGGYNVVCREHDKAWRAYTVLLQLPRAQKVIVRPLRISQDVADGASVAVGGRVCRIQLYRAVEGG